MVVSVAPKAQKVAVTSYHTFNVSHAVFLLLPPKLDTVSHPVKEWNAGNPWHLSCPNAWAISWAAKNQKLFPVPKATHIWSILRRSAAAIARTTTSVSTVRIDTLVYPCFIASSTWSSIMVSASSCVHGARPAMYLACVQTTSLWRVPMTCFSVSWAASLVARKENSSALFSSIPRKAYQFPGMELDGSTRLRMPLPLFVRVSAFKLSGMYSSQTISTLIACCSRDVMYDKKTCVA